MEARIKQDLHDVLEQTIDILSDTNADTWKLKGLSNHVIHNASIFQDEHSVSLAVLVYSLSKLIERNQLTDRLKFNNELKTAKEALIKGTDEEYTQAIAKLFDIIKDEDVKFSQYVQEVISQAQIKKGSKLYEHGISASKTAEVLGISLWELQQYLGQVSITDINKDISNVRERLKFTRRLFL